MATSKVARVAREPDQAPEEQAPISAAVPAAVEPIPAFAEEEPPAEVPADPGAALLPREYVILNGPASYGPVIIEGQRVRVLKDKLYLVRRAEERADILGTGYFRAATVGDLARAEGPAAGPGGAITLDLLPPGAVKGGLTTP